MGRNGVNAVLNLAQLKHLVNKLFRPIISIAR